MTPGMPPPPADDSAGPQVASMAPGANAPAPQKKFGILGRLLGQKYQDEMWRMHEQATFLQNEIHEAWNNPNNRMPDDILDDRINEFAKIIGGSPEHTKQVKDTLKAHTEQIKAGRALAQFHNDTTAKPQQAPPVMPAAAPAPGPQAAPQPQDDSAGPRVGGLPTPPPFASGGSGSTPIPNEPAPMKVASDMSGTGDGIPPPAPVAPAAPPTPVAPQPARYASPNRISRAQLGQEQAAQARPSLEMQADVTRQEAAKTMEARRAMYSKESWFQGLSDRQKGELLSGANITAEPHFSIPGVTMSQAGDMDVNGKAVESGVPGRRTLMSGQWIFTPEPGKWTPKDVTGPDGKVRREFYNPYTREVIDANGKLTSEPKLDFFNQTNPNGTTNRVGVNPVTGQQASSIDSGVNPAMLPTNQQALQYIKSDDGQGHETLVPVITGRQTQKSAPGLPPPPGATPAQSATQPGRGAPTGSIGEPTVIGTKSITPGQRVAFGQKVSAFTNTIDLANSVKSKLPLLGGLIDSKKIEMQLDPQQGIVKAFINRNVPMSDAETKLAGDFISLMEHINTLRGPLAATGFRGAEAWAALQAQRGQLMANPKVTAVVLENTLKALTGQRDILNKGLAGKGNMPNWANEMSAPPANLPAPPDGSVPSLSDIFGKKK